MNKLITLAVLLLSTACAASSGEITIKKHGGDAELIELPKIGIYGNTHFLFAEKNNVQLADHLSEWLKYKSLDRS